MKKQLKTHQILHTNITNHQLDKFVLKNPNTNLQKVAPGRRA